MAAHGGVALVVHEEHGHVGLAEIGLDRDHAVHVVMAARLEDEHAAEMVEPLARVAALLEDRLALHVRIAGADDAHGLAARVHLDGLDRDRLVRGHGQRLWQSLGLAPVPLAPLASHPHHPI